MAIGRISGSVLKSNLTRNGTDLAFETNLLYLDVTNSRIGIGTSEPTTALDVSGTIASTGLTVDTNTLHVDSANNRVGIGTTSPAYQVEIENTGSNALLVLDRTDGAACFIEGQATRSAFGSVGATPLALAYNSFAVVTIGANGAITVNPDGGSPFTFPTSDGSANQFLQTDGSGNVTFQSATVSDISDLTATAAELNVLDGTTLGAANELCVVDPTGNFITTTSTLSIDQGNNYIGINQSSPEVTLHMTGQGAQTAQIRMEQYNDTADAPDLRTRRYRGTIASPLAINSGDYLYRSNHEFWNGSALIVGGTFAFDNTNNANRTQFAVSVTTDGTSADANTPSKVQFKIDGNDSGAITFNNAYKFPTADGSANQVLQTNGSGTLSFTDIVASTGDITFTGSTISSPSNADITLAPGGTGQVVLNQIKSEDSSAIRINDSIDMAGNIVPVADNTYSLGTATSKWSALHVAGSTIFLGNLQLKDTGSNSLTVLQSDGSTPAAVEIPSVLTIVGDDSTGTALNSGETFKFAGTNGITTSVSGDTLTIDGSNISLGDFTFTGSTIASPSNANITLDPGGTGTVDVSSAKITSVGTPTADADAATKAYVDTQVSAVSTTSITEGNSSVAVSDSGTGSITITADGNVELVVNDTNATFSGPVVIKGTNPIQLNDSDDSNYIQFKAPATVTSNRVFVLPDSYGTSGQQLTTNGSGTLSWADAGGGSGASYPNSTISTMPGSEGNYDLAEGPAQDGDETPFEAGGTDAFGVNLGTVFDTMDPVGTTESTDLGSGEAYVGA